VQRPGGESAEGSPAACELCAGADPLVRTPLQDLLPPGQSRFIAQTAHFAVVPTFGCFVAGYLLIVPRAHVLSFGRLDPAQLVEADHLAALLADRLAAVYGLPVLGFEYGINQGGVRRIEHAHWHLLPSEADLGGWLEQRLTGEQISSFAGLADDADGSYIAVRDQAGALTVYPVAGSLEADQRIRVRRTVAALDPRVDTAAWDWADQRCAELIRATVADLGESGP
jgi:diadenosine tetraphosphate (Ap4A) HIT family hydrolase